jgi:aspartyl-tRNA(Asn)/glutamyl-tRNA(Gln) amidotransferase subunit C
VEADRELVMKIAALAMLELSPEEEAELARDMNLIMGYMERLSVVDTQGIEPMEHVLPLKNVLRPDIPEDFSGSDDLLKCAAMVQNDCYVVPSVVDAL